MPHARWRWVLRGSPAGTQEQGEVMGCCAVMGTVSGKARGPTATRLLGKPICCLHILGFPHELVLPGVGQPGRVPPPASPLAQAASC